MATRDTILLPIVLLALVQHGDEAEHSTESPEHGEEEGHLRQLTDFVKSYAMKQGAGMMTTDDDIKCLMQVGQTLVNDKERGHLALVATAVHAIMHTTPHCKLNVLAKGRMFLSTDFLKGFASALLGHSGSASLTSL